MNQADDYIIGHISAIRIALKSYLRSLLEAAVVVKAADSLKDIL